MRFNLPSRTSLAIAALLAGGLALSVSSRPASRAGAAIGAESPASLHRQPVLVELFTSEGCSSCPPADALLARLDATQFVPGAEAIVLSEHVTYWNYLGWSDPFSLEALSQRQQDYATRFGTASVYTPQAIVDGAAEVVGSDAAALTRAVASAAAKPKAELTIDGVAWEGETVRFSVHAARQAPGILYAALAQDAAVSAVRRGENAGRSLHHVAVVRALAEMGDGKADGRPLQLETALPRGAAGAQPVFRLVVFLARRHNGSVTAIAEKQIAP